MVELHAPGAHRRPGRRGPGSRASAHTLVPLAICALPLACLSGGLAAAAPGPRRGSVERLIAAQFTHRQDALGFRWDVAQNGTVADGSNDCFDGGLLLLLNGSHFNPTSRMMTPDGAEYVLSGAAANVKVTRRILVDLKRGAVRYMEVFENPGGAAVKLAVAVRSTLGDSCRQVVTSAGAPFAGSLDAADTGLLALSGSNRPSVMFLLAGPLASGSAGARLNAGPGVAARPVLAVGGRRHFTFTYNVSVEPGATVSIVHLAAQRSGATASGAPDIFKKFCRRGRLVEPRVPRHLRRTVANFSFRPAESAVLKPVLDMAEGLGVERGESDVLVVGENGRLRGAASCERLAVRTVRGRAPDDERLAGERPVEVGLVEVGLVEVGLVEVELDDVALIVGGAGVGRQERVYLRNGEILAGRIEADALTFSVTGAASSSARRQGSAGRGPARLGSPKSGRAEVAGMEVELVPSQLDALFTRADPRDGIPGPEVAAFVVTRSGERLAVTDEGAGVDGVRLEVTTPWGPLRVALEEVKNLSYTRRPRPCHRLALKDGSRVSVVLTGRGIEFDAPRFGKVRLAPQDIEAIVPVTTNRAALIVDGVEVVRRSREPEWARAIRRELWRKVTIERRELPFWEAVALVSSQADVNLMLDPGATRSNAGPAGEKASPPSDGAKGAKAPKPAPAGSGKKPALKAAAGSAPRDVPEKVTVESAGTPLGLALERLLAQADLGYVLMDEAVYVSTAEVIEREQGRAVRARYARAAGTAVASGAEPRWKRRLHDALAREVSFRFADIPAAEAMKRLSEGARVKIRFDPALATDAPMKRVCLEAKAMTLRCALSWVARFAALEYALEDGAVVVAERERSRAADEDHAEIPAPHFLLAGENILVGSFGLDRLRVVTAAGVLSVDARQVHVMELSDAGPGKGAPGFFPLFRFELFGAHGDASRFEGSLSVPLLPVRANGKTFEVPLRHVRSFRAPKPAAPPAAEEEPGQDGEATSTAALFGAGGVLGAWGEVEIFFDEDGPIFLHEELEIVDVYP